MFKSNTVAAAVGGGGLSAPIWGAWLTSGWQVLIAVAGGALLILTIYNKVLEIRQRRRDLATK